jgi:hypothetical protein
VKQRSTRSLSLIAAGAALALTTYGVLLPSASAADDPTVPRPRAATQARQSTQVTPSSPARMTPAWGVNPAPGRDCPAGSTRTTTLAAATFDTGTAAPFTSGMTLVSEGSNAFLRHAGTGSAVPQILASPQLSPGAARVYVKFDVRGDFAAQDVAVAPKYGGTAWAVPAATGAAAQNSWRTVHFDLTDGANEATLGQPFSVVIARDAASRSTVDIDRLAIYQCSPAPTGEPGDFNGDGLAEAKFVMRDGNLILSAGTPTQSRTLWRAGVGWASMTWIGSVGDTNGDGFTDLLARTASGDLLAYFGDGVRTFTSSRKVGNGWQGMRWILPVGDVTGDGRQDLIAGSGDGLMRFYSFRADGGLAGGSVVGSGWGGFRHVVAVRTSGRPGTPSRLYAIDAAGDMRSYVVTGTGNMYGSGTKVGAGWTFPKVASVGDWDGDGMDDILAVSPGGTAFIYPTNGGGRWKERKTLEESIWHAALLVG